METSEKIDILIQAAELAQKAGALTLDDAWAAKEARDVCRMGKGDIDTALENLGLVAEVGQKNGAYTLRDAYFIYQAIQNEEEPAA